MKQRQATDPQIFQKKGWQNSQRMSFNYLTFFLTLPKEPLKDFIHSKFQDLVTSFQTKTNTPIIPSVHATSMPVAEKIAETGFANLSKIDDGYYGKGKTIFNIVF